MSRRKELGCWCYTVLVKLLQDIKAVVAGMVMPLQPKSDREMGKQAQAHQEIDVRARTFALLKQRVPYVAAG
jgi:hypothetical protein